MRRRKRRGLNAANDADADRNSDSVRCVYDYGRTDGDFVEHGKTIPVEPNYADADCKLGGSRARLKPGSTGLGLLRARFDYLI